MLGRKKDTRIYAAVTMASGGRLFLQWPNEQHFNSFLTWVRDRSTYQALVTGQNRHDIYLRPNEVESIEIGAR